MVEVTSPVTSKTEAPGKPESELGSVLVTGATGLVGGAIVRALLKAGYDVHALVRPASNRANLAGYAVTERQGDILDPATVARALEGVRFLVHSAADYRLWARDPEVIARTNVEGTRIVMEAALEAGVERIVYTSSVATIAPAPDGTPADESRKAEPSQEMGPYKRSKIIAERLVERMVAERRLPAVIVNPSTPVGPGDVRPTPTGRLVLDAARGRMPGFVETGLNVAHVDDVAEGHVLALRKGRVGERYILGGDNVPLSEILAAIAKLSGRRPPRIKIPHAAVYPAAVASEAWARITGREPLITREGLRLSRQHMFYSDAKARSELGYKSRLYSEALADAVSWFAANGQLR